MANEVKDWIVTVVYSDQDYPVVPYRVMATTDEIKKIMKSFVTPLIEDLEYILDFDEENFDDENGLNYYAVFPNMHVEVSAVSLNNMQVHTANNFLEEK